MSAYHTPVMLDEVLKYLDIKPGKWYIDCNIGGGGHTKAILENGGNVIGIDLDSDAISEVSKNLKEYIDSKRLILVQDNFSNLRSIIARVAKQSLIRHPELVSGSISGILFDLGVSSYQLEEGHRGFSFNKEAPLDMRMNQTLQIPTAADLVNALHEKELSELFLKLGEESFSRPIAKKIVEYRKTKLIQTTSELANIVLSVRRKKPGDRIHPATKIFQALRIAVNDELNALRDTLPQAFEILEPGGRLVVISFHSLEDRIVKEYFNHIARDTETPTAILINKKIIEPTEEETFTNPRSRSSKLRVVEKI